MNKTLENRNALITGASSGIGKEIALLFAREGAHLCLVARRKKELAAVARQCRSFGTEAIYLGVDIKNQKQVEKMAKKCISVLKRIDILINNAGYAKYGPFLSTPIEEWDRMWMVNVRGAVLVTRAILPSMIAAKNGHIVNVSSRLGIYTSANTSAYCATKFAMSGLSEVLSKELWKDGIKVSTIYLGGVLTQFRGIPPAKKNPEFLEPEDVARAVLDIVTMPGKAVILKAIISSKTVPFVQHESKY